VPASVGVFSSGQYRNLFIEMLGKRDAEIQARLDAAWKQLFYGNDDQGSRHFDAHPYRTSRGSITAGRNQRR